MYYLGTVNFLKIYNDNWSISQNHPFAEDLTETTPLYLNQVEDEDEGEVDMVIIPFPNSALSTHNNKVMIASRFTGHIARIQHFMRVIDSGLEDTDRAKFLLFSVVGDIQHFWAETVIYYEKLQASAEGNQ